MQLAQVKDKNLPMKDKYGVLGFSSPPISS